MAKTTRIQAPKVTGQRRADIIEQVLENMKAQSFRFTSQPVNTGILLAGDPGVGKTSFVRTLSRLLGMNLLTIEAPHITEEHLINIPFIVFKPATGTTEHGHIDIDPDNYDIKLSGSNLAKRLRNMQKIPDAQLLKEINADPNLKQLNQEMGGSETKLAPEISDVREDYTNVLFLDEFFRKTSGNVRNILRDILNGNIGMDKVPAGTYVIYASNMEDEGLDQIPANTEFANKVTLKAPNKEEWFKWLTNKFNGAGEHAHVKLKPEVIKAFKDALEDKHLNHEDVDNAIRTSPRRWEQIILYVNDSLPVENERDAKSLLTNVHNMFKNEQGELSNLEPAVTKVVRKLIGSSTPEHANVDKHHETDWRETLEHQIKLKMKLGKARTYIPFMSGPPGVGKTANAARIAKDLGLVYVYVNPQTLSAEDVIGLPLPEKGKEGELDVKFSEAKLYQKIKKSIEEGERDLLKTMTPAEQAEWKKRKFKYLIFFDEINRVKSPKEFNALRQTILEKKVGEHDLPDESIVISALNPDDPKGTIKLTKHMRDVMDVVPAAPSWEKLKKYLEGLEFPRLRNPSVKDIAIDVVKDFADTFGNKKMKDTDRAKFHLKSGDSDVYKSPREYHSLINNLVFALDRAYSKVDATDYDDEQDYHEALQESLRTAVKHRVRGLMDFIFNDKHGVDNPEAMQDIEEWAENYDFNKAFKKKVKVAGLEEILERHMKDHKLHLKDDLDFVNFINNFDYVEFSEALDRFIKSKLEKDVKNFVLGTTHHKKELVKDAIVDAKEKIGGLEYIIREMMHAAKLHKLSNEVREQIYKGVRNAFDQAVVTPELEDDDVFMEALNLKQSLEKWFKTFDKA